MEDSHRIRAALSLLNIKPGLLLRHYDFEETGRYRKVIEIFSNSLNELTKKYTLKEPNEESDINLSLIHEAFQFLCKTFVGELVKNTEANKQPPYYSTDKIKSDQKTTKPGTTSRSKKKKSKIINEDLMVTFDVESIIEDKPSANRLKKLANRPFFTNRKKMDERVGKTFLDFHSKGGYEEIQQLSTILRISEVKSTRNTKNQATSNLTDKRIFKLKSDEEDEYLEDQPDEKTSKMAKNWGKMITNVNIKQTKKENPIQEIIMLDKIVLEEELLSTNETEEYSSFSWNEICHSDRINLKFYFHQEISRMNHMKDAKSEKNIHRRNRIRKWMRKSANKSNTTSVASKGN